MKKNHKIINEELSRLSEIMGIKFKPLISEQLSEFLEKIGGKSDDVIEKLEASGAKNADELVQKFREIAEKGAETMTTKESEFMTELFTKLFPSEMKAAAEEGFMFLQTKLESKPGLFEKIKGFIGNQSKSTEEVITALEDRGIVPDVISREEALAMREYSMTTEKGVERSYEKIGEPKASDVSTKAAEETGTKGAEEVMASTADDAINIGSIIDDVVRENQSANAGKFIFNEKALLAQLEIKGIKGSKARKIVNLLKKANLKTPAEMRQALADAVRTALKKEGATDAQITKVTDRITNIKDFMFENLGFAGMALWWIGIDLLISSTVQFLMWATTLDKTFPTVYAIFQFLGFRFGASIKTIRQSVEKFRSEVDDESETTTTTTTAAPGGTTTTTTAAPSTGEVSAELKAEIKRNIYDKSGNKMNYGSTWDKMIFSNYNSTNNTVDYRCTINGQDYNGTLKKSSDGKWVDQ